MRVAAFLAGLLLLWAMAPAPAQEGAVSAGDRTAIRTVIEQQMAAFARDDDAAAFAFASPAIQRQFASPDNFMRMVRQGYPSVYRPRAVSFGEIERFAGGIVQEVDLIGPDGNGVRALYMMEREGDGSWRINGVELAPGTGRET